MSWFAPRMPYCSALNTAKTIEIAAVDCCRRIIYQAPDSFAFLIQELTLAVKSG